MLTGRMLFAGDTVSDTLAAVLRETPDLDTLPAQTPRAIRRLIARCLEKNPQRRLRDVGEARIVIEDVRSGAAPDEAPATAPAPTRRAVWRLYGGWVVAAVTLALAVFSMMKGPRVEVNQLPVRRAGMVMSTDDPAARHFFAPVISPDGRYLAFVSKGQVWLRDLTQLNARAVPGTEGGQSPFWSADGEWIGFSRESALMRVKREGGEPSLIVTLPQGMSLQGAGGAVWDERDRIVIGPNTSGLHLVPASGGDVIHWVKPGPDESDFHEVCLLPGGHGYVAVLHSAAGINDLVHVTADGKRKNVVHVDDQLAAPAYSPTGHLLFERRGSTPGIWAIGYDLDAQASVGDPFLVVSGGRQPSVSRDGSLCYVDGIAEPQAQLVWLDRTGRVVGTLEPPDITTRPFPTLSPDGRTVAMANRFGDSRETFLYDVERGTRRRLTFTDYAEELPRWHPNGVDLLDYRFIPPQMYMYSTQSGAAPRPLGPGIMPAVSPDGGTLVYAVQRPGDWNFDIVARPMDGDSTGARDLIATPTVDWYPSFSPDGKFLLYVSGSSGREEVYVTTFPKPSTLWQVSTHGGTFPRWRSDGREIVFTTADRIWAVDVKAGAASLTLGTPRELCARPTTNWSGTWPDGFDISRDGQRILLLQPVAGAGDTPPAIVVVQNWFEEFRGR
jgi:Tol biopolymer transport system component